MVYQLESPDITTIIDYCEDLLKDEKIEVYDFGKRRDLVLHIYVDEDFASKSIEYKIFTFRDGELVDKTEDIYIDKLENELERINADDDVRNRLYFGVQCGHPYGSDYMYEIFTGRSGYDIEFKCKNKKEVLQVIDQLAKDFEKEKHQ